jgi:cytochrome c oxidase cbb3-type subunit III
MRNKLKLSIAFVTVLLLLTAAPVFAAGPPSDSIFNNSLALVLIILMLLLLIIIGVLASVLVGAAAVKTKKRLKKTKDMIVTPMIILFMLIAPSVMAQDPATQTAAPAPHTIGDMPASTFYIMAIIIFLELVVILVLLLNIKFLLRVEKAKLLTEAEVEKTKAIKANKLSWWDRFNKLRPVSQEAELDLGHEYDGIRELNNRLPPWWLYGFYLSIVFAAIYLWRFHVSHSAPSSREEYERSVVKAEIKIKEHLKKKGESVDENTVTYLTGAEDINAGKAIFTDPSKCPVCHNADGGGNAIGPNLTDEYWLNGGSIQSIFKTIKYGTSKGMRSWKDDLSPKQIAQVVSYIKTLQGTKPANPREPQGELYKETAPAGGPADSTNNPISKSIP